jgi:hypothetical protein
MAARRAAAIRGSSAPPRTTCRRPAPTLRVCFAVFLGLLVFLVLLFFFGFAIFFWFCWFAVPAQVRHERPRADLSAQSGAASGFTKASTTPLLSSRGRTRSPARTVERGRARRPGLELGSRRLGVLGLELLRRLWQGVGVQEYIYTCIYIHIYISVYIHTHIDLYICTGLGLGSVGLMTQGVRGSGVSNASTAGRAGFFFRPGERASVLLRSGEAVEASPEDQWLQVRASGTQGTQGTPGLGDQCLHRVVRFHPAECPFPESLSCVNARRVPSSASE